MSPETAATQTDSKTIATTQTGSKTLRILTLGDVHLDTLVLPVSRAQNAGKDNWWRVRRRGGAWLLEEIIRAAIAEIEPYVDKGYEILVESYNHTDAGVQDDKIKSSLDKEYQNSAAILGLFPKKIKSSIGETDRVYRVEKPLGWIHNDRVGGGYETALRRCLQECLPKGTDKSDILVLHDKAREFRSLPLDVLQPVLDRYYIKGKTWIVWHIDSPLIKKNNHFWQIIRSNEDWWHRTVVIVKAECLRQAGANLPEIVSLEGESEKFMDSMRNPPENSALKDLAEVNHLIVHTPRQGVLYAGKDGKLETSCYYCPNLNIQPYPRKLGSMIGYTSILVASIARGIAWSLICNSSKVPEGIIDAIKQGVILDHLYYRCGYGDPTEKELKPFARLFEGYKKLADDKWVQGEEDYSLAAVPLPEREENEPLRNWSRITDFFERKFKLSDKFVAGEWKDRIAGERAFVEYTESLLERIVRDGLEKVILEDAAASEKETHLPMTPDRTLLCPFEVHGTIKTAYRNEIEHFQSIRRIIEKYLFDEVWTSPLSIAVFGPPGSGKSFTIKQLLKTINAEIVKQPLEFNIAQFTEHKDLETAFHKVQDVAVGGGVPLVFFDEFDADFREDKLGWLKFFLAPMQDGTFKAGESVYRIGRAIFVFAGGISHSWNDFYEKHKVEKDKSDKSSGNDNGKTFHDVFRNAKVPDFVSRLRGYLNIETINCPDGQNKVDLILMFRRAVLLRSLLDEHMKLIVDQNTREAGIERELLRAFLTVPRYEHESRSMRAIIEMSQASPRGRFQKSSLPTIEQLKMHVDAREFFKCMDAEEFFKRMNREAEVFFKREAEKLFKRVKREPAPASVKSSTHGGEKPTTPPEESRQETTPTVPTVQPASVPASYNAAGDAQPGSTARASSPVNENQAEVDSQKGNT
jgi:hypothetical protein